MPFARNSNLPPRLVEAIEAATFEDAMDASYTTRAANGSLPVSVQGKTARILLPV